MSLRIIYKAQRGTELRHSRDNKAGVLVMASSCAPSYLLYHHTVNTHLDLTPGEVEDVDPAQSQTQHQEGEVFVPVDQIQHCCSQEEGGLEETEVSSGEQEQWF